MEAALDVGRASALGLGGIARVVGGHRDEAGARTRPVSPVERDRYHLGRHPARARLEDRPAEDIDSEMPELGHGECRVARAVGEVVHQPDAFHAGARRLARGVERGHRAPVDVGTGVDVAVDRALQEIHTGYGQGHLSPPGKAALAGRHVRRGAGNAGAVGEHRAALPTPGNGGLTNYSSDARRGAKRRKKDRPRRVLEISDHGKNPRNKSIGDGVIIGRINDPTQRRGSR